jgi:hypothetical protein
MEHRLGRLEGETALHPLQVTLESTSLQKDSSPEVMQDASEVSALMWLHTHSEWRALDLGPVRIDRNDRSGPILNATAQMSLCQHEVRVNATKRVPHEPDGIEIIERKPGRSGFEDAKQRNNPLDRPRHLNSNNTAWSDFPGCQKVRHAAGLPGQIRSGHAAIAVDQHNFPRLAGRPGCESTVQPRRMNPRDRAG